MRKMYISTAALVVVLFGACYVLGRQEMERTRQLTEALESAFQGGQEMDWEETNGRGETEQVTKDAVQESEIPVVRVEEPVAKTTHLYVRLVDHEVEGRTELVEEAMPDAFLGLTRNEIIDLLQRMTKDSYGNLAADERVHYELISFSSAGLTVKETISANPAAYECFVIAEGEFVNIYTADRTALYLDTMLYRTNFAEEVQEDLARGIYMRTAKDLYDFLQNETS